MGWNKDYKEQDIVKDYTKPLSKIWDNLMPTSYPFVIEFKTNRAVEVHTKKIMGPYHMDENFIDYDCDVTIDNSPLINIGWNGKDKITKKMVDSAYGENYFHNLRGHLVSLASYAGVKFSQFDFGGELNAKTKDNL